MLPPLFGVKAFHFLQASRYIIQNKSAYYEGLRRVTEEGAWEAWVLYMLEGIEPTALDTRNRILAIRDLMDSVRQIIQSQAPKIYTKDLVEIIFRNPYCKIAFIEEAGLAKRQTASVYLQTLETLGLLKGFKIGREIYYLNLPFMNLLST